MYQYHLPEPIVIRLIDDLGWELRQKAAQYVIEHPNRTGAERGKLEEQMVGALAEIVTRHLLGMSAINAVDHPLAYDFLLPSGVKVDVKCRGGELPFQKEYASSDGLPREAKHNLFARQVYDDNLDADIYLLTHLETPHKGKLPGTRRQRKWALYICGWVSKGRVAREGVYLPRGSLSERGRTWFTYRGQEIEFYNRNLNGLSDVRQLLSVDVQDVAMDRSRTGDLNVTWVDAVRIAYDLVGRGVLKQEHVDYLENESDIKGTVKPILNPNQYYHLLRWLRSKGRVTDDELAAASAMLPEEPYAGI